ncbi:MAG: hypothetical protein J6R44_04455 [Clostridia bacterium]|nr:hypothetical protein [Clostridia bacterium]
MTLEQFRQMHSILIEHYQFIEMHLEGIYAFVCGREFLSGLEEVEKSNMGKISFEIKRIEKERGIEIIPTNLDKRIDEAIRRRNYWCHNCYTDMIFKTNGDPKKESDVNAMIADYQEARELREILFGIKGQLLDKFKRL